MLSQLNGARARVSVIIPTWNRADLLRTLLPNLAGQTHSVDQILIVDNGSTDETRAVAEQYGATWLNMGRNRGFAEAINAGVAQAAGDWLLILNNDVTLEPDYLALLLQAIVETGALFAAGKILQAAEPGSLDGSWDLLSRGAYAWRCGYNRLDGPVWSQRRPIWFAPMTAALFHRSVFERLGEIETGFESYYEDVDFGIRCAMADIRGVYEARAACHHLGKATLGKRGARVYFLSQRNQVLLLAKHYSSGTLRRFAWPIFAGQVLALFAAARQGHLWAATRGKWDAIRQRRFFRNHLPADPTGEKAQRLERILTDSENEILDLQRQIGFDLYWRLYFGLVRSR